MNNQSLLKGKTWYWRQGLAQTPIGSGAVYMWELCLPILQGEAEDISQELKGEGIVLRSKKTHSKDENIPKGAFVLYETAGEIEVTPIEERDNHPNIQKLKSYIQRVGGIIEKRKDEKRDCLTKGLFSRLFGRWGR